MLKPRHHRFLQEYLKGECSAAECARRAGYAPTHSRSTAYKILRTPEIRQHLDSYCSRSGIKAMCCLDKAIDMAMGLVNSRKVSLTGVAQIMKFCRDVLERSLREQE